MYFETIQTTPPITNNIFTRPTTFSHFDTHTHQPAERDNTNTDFFTREKSISKTKIREKFSHFDKQKRFVHPIIGEYLMHIN